MRAEAGSRDHGDARLFEKFRLQRVRCHPGPADVRERIERTAGLDAAHPGNPVERFDNDTPPFVKGRDHRLHRVLWPVERRNSRELRRGR